MRGPEAQIEDDLCRAARESGEWRDRKIQFIGIRGAPDRLFSRIDGTRRVFIEVKRGGERPNKQQALRHYELRQEGFEVHWIDNLSDGLEILGLC